MAFFFFCLWGSKHISFCFCSFCMSLKFLNVNFVLCVLHVSRIFPQPVAPRYRIGTSDAREKIAADIANCRCCYLCGNKWRFGKFFVPRLPHFYLVLRSISGLNVRTRESSQSGGCVKIFEQLHFGKSKWVKCQIMQTTL